jgi:hypothetical protein
MGTLQLSDDFIKSYTEFNSFPLNLVHKATYFGAQQAYVDRLNDTSSRLFTQRDDVEVPFRDLLPSGQSKVAQFCGRPKFLLSAGFVKRYIIDDNKLKDWLGDNSVVGPNTQTTSGELATKADPKCRFM